MQNFWSWRPKTKINIAANAILNLFLMATNYNSYIVTSYFALQTSTSVQNLGQYLNPRLNYNFLKFKMAAVRHLGILISPYTINHPRRLYVGLHQPLKFYANPIVLKTLTLILCRIGLKCLFTPQNFGFWGLVGLDPLNVGLIDYRPDPQQAHLHLKQRCHSIGSIFVTRRQGERICLSVCL